MTCQFRPLLDAELTVRLRTRHEMDLFVDMRGDGWRASSSQHMRLGALGLAGHSQGRKEPEHSEAEARCGTPMVQTILQKTKMRKRRAHLPHHHPLTFDLAEEHSIRVFLVRAFKCPVKG